jgi:FAD/FMN-containing dehydrogenase
MATLLADIRLHAGGGWEGHVFFLIKHPITENQLSTNSYESVKRFCQEHNLTEDPEIQIFLSKLEYDENYGWLVPKQFLEKSAIISSASRYLQDIQK